MAKGNKRGGRRRGDSDSDDDDNSNGVSKDNDNDNNEKETSSKNKNKKLDFAQRRELQREAAAEKRRLKQTCRLCGQAGHVRRECPGIDDDGRGESKFTKSKGDPGALSLKTASTDKKKKKGAKNRGRKQSFSKQEELVLPEGFSTITTSDESSEEDPFRYYDAGCDHAATIKYLCSGRGKNKIPLKEAVAEYQDAIASSGSNYGGCITRSVLRPGWSTSEATPLAIQPENVWFVVGLDHDDSNKTDGFHLLETTVSNNSDDRIVGVFCDLDYTPGATSRCDCDSQLERLRSTCQVANHAGLPIQIRTFPPPPAVASESDIDSPYSKVMRDLTRVLSETTAAFPSLKIHLSCWSGRAEQMHELLLNKNLWIGLDGTVSFAKATCVHECAFDISLDKLLLETGGTTIPSRVANAKGRDAFCHSCLVPYVAEAVAQHKKHCTAQEVARAASANTVMLYPQLVKSVSQEKEEG